MATETVILCGRGPSIQRFHWPAGCDVAAVSAGIFAVGDRADHWITVDDPSAFRQGYYLDNPQAWCHAEHCQWWPVLTDVKTRKHVPECIMLSYWVKPDKDDETKPWMHWPNVTPHLFQHEAPPNFGPDGMIGMGGSRYTNSLLFAVQVVARLGYKRVIFAGCDLDSLLGYMYIAALLELWWDDAKDAGIEWVCASDESNLARWMPVEVPA